MQILSVEAWADREGIDRRKAQKWAQEGRLPLVPRPIVLRGVSADTTLRDVRNVRLKK